MTVLLAADQVELYQPSTGQDERGWALPPATASPVWSGSGNLQLGLGVSDPRAAEGGGHGPFDPAAVPSGELYLPPEAAPQEGALAVIRGAEYVLSQVRLVTDPAGGALGCYTAHVTAVVPRG